MPPLLFAIVLEFLYEMLIEAKNDKRIDVYKMGGIEVESHLALADDVVLFFRVNEKLLQTIREILQEFKEFLGLEINGSKSS